MSNKIYDAQLQLREIILKALNIAVANGELPEGDVPSYVIEIPADTSHGDFATNIAMAGAKAFRLPPRKTAEILTSYMDFTDTYFRGFEIAGPGFINFFLNSLWFSDAVLAVLKDNESYGRSDFGQNQKVMLEFVSANPTGPMHMGNARGGSIGDCLASAMDFAGFEVEREFYVNDAGNQIAKFGMSLDIRYQQIYKGEDAIPFPEDGYHGDDIKERAKQYVDIHGDKLLSVSEEERRQALIDFALPKNIEKLRTDLQKYNIEYDTWFRESSLYSDGTVDKVLEILSERGLTYKKDDAIWYKASEYGSEKDEVLVRGNGIPTYFAADIAYHYNKFAVRHFDRVINVWGADHHGHVARLKGSMDAVGLDGSKLDIILMQLVRLTRDGEIVKMSKRTGKSITLTDLIEDVPVPAARFFFNMREPNSTLDFDLDLAAEQSSQNPVYYVQYAHARICSIIKNLAAEGITLRTCTNDELLSLSSGEEIELIRKLSLLPNEIISAAKNYDPARLTHYVIDVATLFHKFYNSCKVKGENEVLMQSRLNLCMAVKIILKNVLALLKIDAPEVM